MKTLVTMVVVLGLCLGMAAQSRINISGSQIGSVFLTSSATQTSECQGPCTASLPLFQKSNGTLQTVTCPLPSGSTCVFHISLETSTSAYNNNGLEEVSAFYQFLIDMKIPQPGPTDKTGMVLWGCTGNESPNCSGLTYNYGQTLFAPDHVSVVATVKNTVTNQPHQLIINDVCESQNNCVISVTRALAKIDIYQMN